MRQFGLKVADVFFGKGGLVCWLLVVDLEKTEEGIEFPVVESGL